MSTNYKALHCNVPFHQGWCAGDARSQFKEQKHAAHKVLARGGLPRPVHHARKAGGRPQSERRRSEQLPLVNAFTNLQEHRCLDQAIISKSNNEKGGSCQEARRQPLSRVTPPFAAPDFYKPLNTQDNTTVWDAPRNRRS